MDKTAIYEILKEFAESSSAAKTNKKMETSKVLALWAALYFSLIGVIVLAFDALQISLSPDVFVIVRYILAGCLTVITAYFGKSGLEKHSRNKYKVDKNGNPILTGKSAELAEGDSTDAEG